MKTKIAKIILEGSIYSIIVTLLLCLIFFTTNIFDTNPNPEFARKWDGGCTGWTSYLAAHEMISNWLLWYAYCNISVIIYRLHPRPMDNITFHALVGVFIFCGMKHLVDAITVLNPIYEQSILFGYAVSIVSIICMFGAARSLIRVNQNMTAEKEAIYESIRTNK